MNRIASLIIFMCLLGACTGKPAHTDQLAQSCCSARAGAEGACTGDKHCTACKNCKRCKHCSKEGGTCGVCK